jgi:penicillin-binding protein 1A
MMQTSQPAAPRPERTDKIDLRPPGSGRIYWWLFKSALLLAFFGLIAGAGVFAYFYFNTPQVEALRDYAPPMVSEVFARSDKKIGEFYNERRLVAQREELPPLLVKAFVASEDRNFFTHQGLDLRGILRASIKNVIAGELKQGGSTITQQVAKSLLLSS